MSGPDIKQAKDPPVAVNNRALQNHLFEVSAALEYNLHTIINMYTAVRLWELHRSPEQFLQDIWHPPPQVHSPIVKRTTLNDLCMANIPGESPQELLDPGEGIITIHAAKTVQSQKNTGTSLR